MSLKKKIVLSFFISAFIIAVLVAFEYFSFLKIRNEIRHLQITDTIRSESLQLRRHEKNYFLYPLKAGDEAATVYEYLAELKSLIDNKLPIDRSGKLYLFKDRIEKYEQRFRAVGSATIELSREFEKVKASHGKDERFDPLIELTFLEHPLIMAEFLEKTFSLPPEHKLIVGLKKLDQEINLLRKSGEAIINTSQELDRIARENVDRTISMSQIAIVIFFSLFFVIGIVALFVISNSVVNRLNFLINVVEKTGKGDFPKVNLRGRKWIGDEVGVLTEKFNTMGQQLVQREEELRRKNAELLQSKKLAAIGTLASGVAHELNNPLNNIYISVQRLVRENVNTCPGIIKESIQDIFTQTIRVKRIVGDLLEFAGGRNPQVMPVELNAVLFKAFEFVGQSVDVKEINFTVDSDPDTVFLSVDPEQLERVFLNLFNNAIDAMSGKGNLSIKVRAEKESVEVSVSDQGKGMPAEIVEKIFDPFFTTKDKGTGLGLAIVFNLIKKHNGDIRAQSREGKGTTFIITLPRLEESL